jgi:hypothetical protein
MDLVNQLLPIDVRDTSIAGVHTYPITKILKMEYIIDPSEPIIFFDKSGKKVLTLNDLRIRRDINFSRSKRSFGSTRLLISSRLISYIAPLAQTFKFQLLAYLNQRESAIIAHLPLCFKAKYPPSLLIFNSDNTFNPKAILFDDRDLGTQISVEVFERNYLGKQCKQ